MHSSSPLTKGHPFYSDGSHLSPEGIEHIAPVVEKIANKFIADVMISDSCGCAVDGEYEDWYGFVLDRLVDVPVRPRWGASSHRGSFRKSVYRAWREFPAAQTIVIMIAGNDLWGNITPAELRREMDSLRRYWKTGDVDLIFVDVVPRW